MLKILSAQISNISVPSGKKFLICTERIKDKKKAAAGIKKLLKLHEPEKKIKKEKKNKKYKWKEKWYFDGVISSV